LTATTSTYTVVATPTFDDLECEALSLKHTGEKCIKNTTVCSTANAEAVANCWGR